MITFSAESFFIEMRTYFVTLGTIVALLSFVQCETPSKSYSSYRPYPFCNPSDFMRYPTNAEEVVAIVSEAISRKVTVKAFGARHSQSDIICTEGIPVDMNRLKSFQMNTDNITATFGAGVTLKEAGEFLLQHGRALRTTPAYGYITLGGAVGTGAHGSSIKYNSSLSAQVVSMKVVDGRGEIVDISDPDDLKAFKTHLGLLGIIVEVTLFTVPLYKVLAHNYIVPDTILTDGTALRWAQTSDQIMFYWFPTFKQVVVANLTFVPVDRPGTAYTNIVPPSYGFFNLIVKKAKEIAFDLTSSECTAASTLGNKIMHVVELLSQLSTVADMPGLKPIYTEDGILVENPAVGYPHSMLSTTCSEQNAGFTGTACLWAHGDINSNLTVFDNEMAIGLEDLEDLVLAVKDIQTKTPVLFPIDGLVFRFSGQSDSYMSTAYGKDSIHVEFILVKRSEAYNDAVGGLAGYQTILQTMAKRMSARTHWGKSGMVYHSGDMLNLKLETLDSESFIAAMGRFDPNGIFQNKFGRRLRGIATGDVDVDPQTIHCALLDNCFCSVDSDCAETQSCVTLPGYDSYPVCKTRNEVPEKPFDKSAFSAPENPLNWLFSSVPILFGTSPVDPFKWLYLTAPILATNVLVNCSLNNLLTTATNVGGSLL